MRLAAWESATPVLPVVTAKVRWNAIVVARIETDHYTARETAETRDGVYACCFGLWLRYYTVFNVAQCAAMLAGECGILPRTEGDSAAYLDGWRRVLKSDVRLIVQAAAAAQRAADWVQGRRFERTETRETAAA